MTKKLDQEKKENCQLNNKIRDLENEINKLSENAKHFENYLQQNNKTDELDRENRKLRSELEYFKYFKKI